MDHSELSLDALIAQWCEAALPSNLETERLRTQILTADEGRSVEWWKERFSCLKTAMRAGLPTVA